MTEAFVEHEARTRERYMGDEGHPIDTHEQECHYYVAIVFEPEVGMDDHERSKMDMQRHTTIGRRMACSFYLTHRWIEGIVHRRRGTDFTYSTAQECQIAWADFEQDGLWPWDIVA